MTTWFCLLTQYPGGPYGGAGASGPFSTRDRAEEAAIAVLGAGAIRVEIIDSRIAKELVASGRIAHAEGDFLRRIVQHNPTTLRESVKRAADQGDPVAARALADMDEEGT